MSKIFIKKQVNPTALELNFLIPEILILVALFVLSFFFSMYPVLIYLILLGIWMLVSYLLHRKHPEGTLFSKNNVLYYYHLYKLKSIKFDDITNIKLKENKDNKFIIEYKEEDKIKQIKIKNHMASTLVIELNKTIHKAMKKQK